MGGDIWVNSVYGQGSQFYFTTRARMGQWTLESVRSKMTQSHPGRRILLIDTLAQDANVLEAVELSGLEVTVVKSPEEVLMKHAGQTFDTVIVDQMSIAEDLREVEHLRYIPLILVAPEVPRMNLKYCLDYGIANCIESPTNAQDICNALTPALETSSRNPADVNGDSPMKVLLAEDSELYALSYHN